MTKTLQGRRLWFTAPLLVATLGCVQYSNKEFALHWLELKPPPTEEDVARFREQFPQQSVTTTQPGTWNKLEPGMTRAMVQTLTGDRFREKDRYIAVLEQDGSTLWNRRRIRLFFDTRNQREDDVLEAIIVHHTQMGLPRSTDYP